MVSCLKNSENGVFSWLLCLALVATFSCVCSAADAGRVQGHFSKDAVFIPIKSRNDGYAKLLSMNDPSLRAGALLAYAHTADPVAPVIISLFLDDEETAPKTKYLPRSGRVCDFAAEALDAYYHYPFGKLPANADQARRNARIRKWREWFQRTLTEIFGPKGGPLRGVPEPDVPIGPESEPSQDRAAAGKK